MSRHVRTTLPPGPASAAVARRFVRHALKEWQGSGAAADIALLTSEIVTNALVHAGTGIELACHVEGGSGDDGPECQQASARIEVTDTGRGRLVPAPRLTVPAGDATENGRGLFIVDQLADSWGVSYMGGTKSVWFRRLLPAAGTPAAGIPAPGGMAAGPAAGANGQESRLELARILANSSLSSGFLNRVLGLVRDSTGAGTACILSAVDDPFWLAVVAGAGDLDAPRVALVPAAGPFDLARAPALCDDASSGPDHVPALCSYPWRSLATVPLFANGLVIGLLAVAAREPGRFSQQTVLSLRRAADEMAVAVERLWLAEHAGDRQCSAAFLAEADGLLAGSTELEDIAVLSAMLVVPRIADWCAVYLADEPGYARLAHVWHADERLLGPLRAKLAGQPPPAAPGPRARAAAHGRPPAADVPLVYGTQWLGTLLVDPARLLAEPELAGLLDELSRRVAFALDHASGQRRETLTSRVLQQSLRPATVGDVPGIDVSAGYEPATATCAVGGDFYDLFPAGPDRWCLVLGDACGHGPEAAAVTGLARNAARLLARDGHGVTAILDRLNRAVIDDCAPDRLLSMLCAEVFPLGGGGARLRLVSAGHPLPLLLRAAGRAEPVGEPQVLLGVLPDPGYHASVIELAPGDALVCVTDGVTERTDGIRQLDDNNGLARLASGWAGLSAAAIVGRIRAAVHGFTAEPPRDDIAMLVLAARKPGGTAQSR